MNNVCMRESNKMFSRVVDEALDCLGYGKDQILRRVRFYENLTHTIGKVIRRISNINADIIIAGSRGEGVPFKSDADVIHINRDVVCVEEGGYEDGLSTFKVEMTDTTPGYIKLSVCHPVVYYNPSSCFLCRSTTYRSVCGKIVEYLSSLKYLNKIRRFMSLEYPVDNFTITMKKSNGPAISVTMKIKHPFLNVSLSVEQDFVYALPVHVPSVFSLWGSRERLYDWPSKELIDDIASTEAICVPVSLKQSKNCDLEWRLCFPQGDKKLILSMNNSQIKLYILLKVIFKDIVSKKDFGLTSYMIKNIVCWTCEGIASERFAPEFLVDRLRNSLFFLKQCLEDNILPCYLLPTRNLFIEQIEGYMKLRAIHTVSMILNSNCLYLMQCDQLSKSMILTYMHPTLAMKAMSLRNYLEETFANICGKSIEACSLNKDAISSTLIQSFSNPETMQAAVVLINSIGLDMVLQLFDPRFMDKGKCSFLDMIFH